MVDAEIDLGFTAFSLTMLTMLITAGIAATLPAGQIRPFIAALVIFSVWTIVGFSSAKLPLSISYSALFLLDFGAAIAFYFLSKPQKIEGSETLQSNDWASYICAFFILIALFEIVGSAKLYDYAGKPLLIGIITAIWLIIAIGFIRGFGASIFLVFAIASSFTVYFAFSAYYLTLNLITLVPTVIVTFKSCQTIRENFAK